jgi:4-oxalocrotonate tautomerase
VPYVNIKIADEGATPEQKARLVEGATHLLQDVLGKAPASTSVVIDEVSTDNWGVGGRTLSARRQQAGK